MPERPKRLHALDWPASFGDPRAELATLEKRLRVFAEGDLVLLPEACLTGYVSAAGDYDLRPFAEPKDGPTVMAVRAFAKERGLYVVHPLIERAAGGIPIERPRFYNALVGAGPEGEGFLHYRKRHPWYPESWATGGAADYPDILLGDLRLTSAICFDLHFLAEEASDRLAACDVLLFSSAWVEEGDSRPTVLAALARRFELTVVNANWSRGIVSCGGQGRSMIVDPRGHIVLAENGVASGPSP